MKFHLPHIVGGLLAAAAIPASLLGTTEWLYAAPAEPAFPVVQTVTVSGSVTYPLSGEFLRDGRPAAAPRHTEELRAFEIMAYQVSLLDYGRCVEAGACRAADTAPRQAPDTPVVGVSYLDAEAYAAWYSKETGKRWRLPTAGEWALAAAERFNGEDLPVIDDPDNPAQRWISAYQSEAARARSFAGDKAPQPAGTFGANSLGVHDLAGNVWEWTSTCYARSTLASDSNEIASAVENCGVHVLEGRHRAYMSNFIREGKSGGCAVGVPPDNLGFRLVREPNDLTPVAWLRNAIRGIFR